MNITCPKCKFRHPADVSCATAKARAQAASIKREADAFIEQENERAKNVTLTCPVCHHEISVTLEALK
jgi:C4-type Zn-finger protein